MSIHFPRRSYYTPWSYCTCRRVMSYLLSYKNSCKYKLWVWWILHRHDQRISSCSLQSNNAANTLASPLSQINLPSGPLANSLSGVRNIEQIDVHKGTNTGSVTACRHGRRQRDLRLSSPRFRSIHCTSLLLSPRLFQSGLVCFSLVLHRCQLLLETRHLLLML